MTTRSIATRRGMNRRALLASAAAGTLGIATGFARTSSAQARTKLKVLTAGGVDPAIHFWFYTRDNGIYEKHGLDVEMKTVVAETTTMRGLIAGEADVAGTVGATSAMRAFDSGAKLLCLSAFAPKLDYHIVANKAVKSLKEIEGHSFAVSQLGTVSQFVPSLMMKQLSVDPNKVRWVPLGNSAARLQGVIGKTVDAGTVNASLAERAKAYDYIHVIGEADKIVPNFVYTWDITTTDAAREKMAVLKAFVAATTEGIQWALANPQKAVEISQRILPDTGKDEVAFAINYYIREKFWNVNGVLPKATWDFTTQALVDAGYLKVVPAYKDFVIS